MARYREDIGPGSGRVISKVMIKSKLLLVAIVATSILVPAGVRADSIQIQIGDRPFYNHGPRYWDGDYAMVWVPGHMSRSGHRWIHGQYVRGERRQHQWNRPHDDRHDDYQGDDRR